MTDAPYNPYAPPASDQPGGGVASGQAGHDFWREGSLLVARKGAVLPTDRCIKTGEAADDQPVHRKLQWAPPWLAVTIVISPIIYIIVYLIIRKTGAITFGVSPQFRTRRRNGIILTVGGVLALVSMFYGGATLESPFVILGGGLLFLGTLVAGVLMMQPFRVHKIDREFIYLKVNEAYLDGIPSPIDQ